MTNDIGVISRHARHEIRNLINHILGSSQLLVEEVGDLQMDDLVAQLTQIRDDGRLTLTLAEELFAASDDSDRATEATKTKLGATVTQILDSWAKTRSLIQERGHGDLIDAPDPIDVGARRILEFIADPSILAAEPDGDQANALRGESAPVSSEAAETDRDGQPSQILVVDDSAANRGILVRMLRRLGHEALEAENGLRALEVLAQSDMDLVLLDLTMPGMSGFEVLERRRADARLREVPFIVISALDEQESVVRCIEMGAEDYLLKPFDPVLLRARLGACLEKKRLRDQQTRYLATIEAQSAELAELNRTLEARVASQVEDIERLHQLKRFLPPQIAEAIISSGEQVLEPHRRDITVAFCDLRGFTAFAETAEPEDVMDVLRDYHNAIGDLIYQLEGTLEHFAGDGIMVFFNDPVPCSDPALRAVRMGLAMRERIANLAVGWRRRGHQLGFGMGIAMGYATIGPVGFEGRYDYAAIGSVANLAARLCGEAEPGQIVVSQRVVIAIEESVECEPMGDLQLKGFTRPVTAFGIVNYKEGWSFSEGG